MLTFEDCLGLCELSEEEIRAIAEHEHLPQIVALELGNYLMRGPDGELLVSHMFIDDIRAAERRGDLAHAVQLKRALRDFIEAHLGRRLSRIYDPAGGAQSGAASKALPSTPDAPAKVRSSTIRPLGRTHWPSHRGPTGRG